ncbi:hypothetical protein PGO_003815, partial [Plasmodium gonderi]
YKLKEKLRNNLKYDNDLVESVSLSYKTFEDSFFFYDRDIDAKTYNKVCHGLYNYSGDEELKILENLENVYKIIEELKYNPNYFTSCKKNYVEYMNSLKLCKYRSNNIFNSMLEKIENLYDKKCPMEKTQLDSPRLDTQGSEITEISSIVTASNTAETNALSVIETIKGVNIGTFSFISVILIA